MPIGIYCRQNLSHKCAAMAVMAHNRRDLSGVVASSETGAIVRIFHTMQRDHHDPEALGRCAAKMLLSQGAGALLTPVEGAAK